MKNRNSLVVKLLIFTSFVGILTIASVEILTSQRLVGHFQELDEEVAVESLNRSLDVIQGEIRFLHNLAESIASADNIPDYEQVLEILDLDVVSSAGDGDTFHGISGFMKYDDSIEMDNGLSRTDRGFVRINDMGNRFDRVLRGSFAGERSFDWGFVNFAGDSQLYLLCQNSSNDGNTVVVGRRLDAAIARYTARTESVEVIFSNAGGSTNVQEPIRLRDTRSTYPVFTRVTRDHVVFELKDDGRIYSSIVVDVPYLEDGLNIHLSKEAVIRKTGRREILILQVVYIASYLLLLGIIAFWIIGILTRAFRRLIRGMDSWDGLRLPDFGNLPERKDEIGLIANTFGEMSAEILKKTRSLEEQAVRDGLTGLFNRRRFDEAFTSEWKRHQRKNVSLAVIMADVDHFKLFNDTYGHPEGDICLRRVAGQIEQALKRPGDIPFRYGGEEFAIILADTDEKGAVKVAEELRLAVQDLAIPNGKADPGVVTMSLGVTASIPDNESEEDSRTRLLGRADEALYRAKKEGRNRTCDSAG